LIFIDNPLNISMGGNGGNSAYALARLGAPTALCGAVGQDLLGDALRQWLRAAQVDLSGLQGSATHATSSSTIIMTDAANQIVFHHLGATTQADFDQMPAALFSNAKALLATSFSLLPKLRAGGFAQALASVQQAGGLTALDIGPAIGQPVSLAEIAPLLPKVDYLIANTHELLVLTKADDWRQAAAQTLAAGAQRVVIKQGEQGAALWTPNEQIHVPAFKVAANIAVGAGDSFDAGLLFALQQGWPPASALRLGSAVAACVVASRRGILDSPTFEQAYSLFGTI
jgi:sugar/nucleoside kinase (ribokinase family)